MSENNGTLAVYVVHIALINEALRAGTHFVCSSHFYKSIVHQENNRLRLGVISYALIGLGSLHSCELCDREIGASGLTEHNGTEFPKLSRKSESPY